MKKKFHLYIFLFCSAVSCRFSDLNTKRENKDFNTCPYIILSASGCNGPCPLNTLWVDKQGNYEYWGIYSDRKLGINQGVFNKKQIVQVDSIIKKEANFIDTKQVDLPVLSRTLFWFCKDSLKITHHTSNNMIFKSLEKLVFNDSSQLKKKYEVGKLSLKLTHKKNNYEKVYIYYPYANLFLVRYQKSQQNFTDTLFCPPSTIYELFAKINQSPRATSNVLKKSNDNIIKVVGRVEHSDSKKVLFDINADYPNFDKRYLDIERFINRLCKK